jgi:hypothetical protein
VSRESPENEVGDAILGLRNWWFIAFQVRYSSLKITSIYAHFAREKKRAMAEKLPVYSNEQFVLNRELS